MIIVALASPDGNQIMLGRGKTWQKGFFSCIAGFMEPGESIEDTVRREAKEEIGVEVDKIIYHSSQVRTVFPGFFRFRSIDNASRA